MTPEDITAMDQAVTNLAHKAGAAAVQYGPQALSIAEGYLHALAILSVVGDVVECLPPIIFWVLIVKVYKTYKEREVDEFGYLSGYGVGLLILSVINVTYTGLALVIGVSDFLSPQTFFGLFAPKIAVLNYAISLVQ